MEDREFQVWEIEQPSCDLFKDPEEEDKAIWDVLDSYEGQWLTSEMVQNILNEEYNIFMSKEEVATKIDNASFIIEWKWPEFRTLGSSSIFEEYSVNPTIFEQDPQQRNEDSEKVDVDAIKQDLNNLEKKFIKKEIERKKIKFAAKEIDPNEILEKDSSSSLLMKFTIRLMEIFVDFEGTPLGTAEIREIYESKYLPLEHFGRRVFDVLNVLTAVGKITKENRRYQLKN